MMVPVPHVTSGLGVRKFQADGFLLTRVYSTVVKTRRMEEVKMGLPRFTFLRTAS